MNNHTSSARRRKKRKARFSWRRKRDRRGAIAVLAAVLMVLLLTMLAFAIDTGYIASTQVELKRAVDAGALAGAGALVEGGSTAEAQAYDFVSRNLVASEAVPESDVQIYLGEWDVDTRTFRETYYQPSAIRVVATRREAPFFFAKVLGEDNFDVTEEAIATYQPRDIMVVLDYSGSMNDDSEFKHMSRLGRAAIEANLLQIYNELGAPTYGSMNWTPRYISSTNYYTVRNSLGLNGVSYPYPSGSWSDYFRYVQRDYYVYRAGYRKKYGYMTLINYWLYRKPMYSQTPDLWMTSEQPITALKNAVTLFLNYVSAAELDDRVGLSVYTSRNGTAVLEHELSYDYDDIDYISRHRQAGHYHTMTNIGDGIKNAREHLVAEGRNGAYKMIVLMTDGKANRPSGTDPEAYALNQARIAGNAGIPILTISLGAGADEDLMDGIAERTSGIHFNIPGGQTVEEYEDDLKDVFTLIAKDRPLRLVK